MRQNSAFYMLLLLVSSSLHAQISKTIFDNTLQEMQKLYAPRLERDLNLKLENIKGYWSSQNQFTASSARVIDSEREARIQIDGSLAQKTYINKAAFVLVVCHELGHIYKDRRGIPTLRKEGQADYFASQCAMDYFNGVEKSTVEDIPLTVKQECSTNENTAKNAESCMQVVSGILSFGKAFNITLNSLSLTSDNKDFVKHMGLHPAASCRVKTLLAGLFHKEMPTCISQLLSTKI